MNIKMLDAYDVLKCYAQPENRLEYPDGALKFLRTQDGCDFYYQNGARAAKLEFSKNKKLTMPGYVLRTWSQNATQIELKATGRINQEPSWFCLYDKKTGNRQEFFVANKYHCFYNKHGQIIKYNVYVDNKWVDLFALCSKNNPGASYDFIKMVIDGLCVQLHAERKLSNYLTDKDFDARRRFMLNIQQERGSR